MDLGGKKVSIFGIQGSGKTYLARSLLAQFRNPFVFTVHADDFKGDRCYLYVPKHPVREFEAVCTKVLELAKKRKVDAFFVDEADMFVRENYDLNPALNDLVINHRHYGLAMFFLSRRPQDIPTKIVESSHYIFIFKLEGDNALKKFHEIDRRLPPLMERLDYDRHNFIVKELGRPPFINTPVGGDVANPAIPESQPSTPENGGLSRYGSPPTE